MIAASLISTSCLSNELQTWCEFKYSSCVRRHNTICDKETLDVKNAVLPLNFLSNTRL